MKNFKIELIIEEMIDKISSDPIMLTILIIMGCLIMLMFFQMLIVKKSPKLGENIYNNDIPSDLSAMIVANINNISKKRLAIADIKTTISIGIVSLITKKYIEFIDINRGIYKILDSSEYLTEEEILLKKTLEKQILTNTNNTGNINNLLDSVLENTSLSNEDKIEIMKAAVNKNDKIEEYELSKIHYKDFHNLQAELMNIIKNKNSDLVEIGILNKIIKIMYYIFYIFSIFLGIYGLTGYMVPTIVVGINVIIWYTAFTIRLSSKPTVFLALISLIGYTLYSKNALASILVLLYIVIYSIYNKRTLVFTEKGFIINQKINGIENYIINSQKNLDKYTNSYVLFSHIEKILPYSLALGKTKKNIKSITSLIK